MRGSIKLFTWLGIPVHMHWSFGLIFVYAGYLSYSNGQDWSGMLWLCTFIIAMFICVLLHEYGHSLMARRYGVNTKDIILTPIGGVARLERMPERPMQEFLVAIAGPMVNVVIAIVLFGLSTIIFTGERWVLFQMMVEQNSIFGSDTVTIDEPIDQPTGFLAGLLFLLPALFVTNIALVLFNLIPAFPMDGGRIFRSLLAMRLGRVRATKIAAWVGQIIAVGFVGFGLYNQMFMMALIGVFVFSMARNENSMVQLDDVLRRFRVRDILRPQFTRLADNDWMQTPINLLPHGLERHFLVFNMDDQLTGILKEEDIAEAAQRKDFSAPVNKYTKTRYTSVHPEESIQFVYQLIQQGQSIVPVYDNGTLLGIVDEAGLQYFMQKRM
jgi:Zn-dependent protease